MKKAALHNLGCKVNAYEAEAMKQQLEEAGYEIVPFEERADVYIINTCSVTNIADRKSRQMLHRAKKRNPDSVVVAAGCYVQVAAKSLLEDSSVDLVIGNNRKGELASILETYLDARDRGGSKPEYVEDIARSARYEELRVERAGDHTRGFIKVQDGCNQFCSYCIIPYTRGRVRSRSPQDVAREVEGFARAGYQEVVLTGIHLSSYGIDCPQGRTGLLELTEQVQGIEGIRRIRLGSLEPRIVTEAFAARLASMDKVCPHFHLSLQSGCDKTLARMNRRYTTEEYLRSCEILRKHFGNPAITTDVIVGFPQETTEEFEQTRQFLERVHFYEMHVFKYSRRQGTRAASMEGQVPEELKAVRSEELIRLGERMSREYRESLVGRPVEVLLEERVAIGDSLYAAGYTREYVKAAVPMEAGEQEWEKTGTGLLVEARPVGMMNQEILKIQPNDTKNE